MNNFVVMGSTGPDYPYLTDVVENQVLHFGHNWADRMHYEGVDVFIRKGIEILSLMDKRTSSFKICLAWFAGYTSHVIADSFVHPVVNSVVHGPYIFTHTEHGNCELVQDIYIFNNKTGSDICTAAARGGTFGYLDILDDCSVAENPDKVNPDIRDFWTELLKAAHPFASEFFGTINPDTWHKNYKNRVDFASDSRSIFRHVLDIANAPRYVSLDDVSSEDLEKYINEVATPIGTRVHYDIVFNQAVDKIVGFWKELFQCIQNNTNPTNTLIKDWNLDNGVDESLIDLWKEA